MKPPGRNTILAREWKRAGMVPVEQHYIPQDEQLFTIIVSCKWVHTKSKNCKRTFQLPFTFSIQKNKNFRFIYFFIIYLLFTYYYLLIYLFIYYLLIYLFLEKFISSMQLKKYEMHFRLSILSSKHAGCCGTWEKRPAIANWCLIPGKK